MPDVSEIGSRLRALRQDAHLSELVVAKAAGLTVEELSALEAGRGLTARATARLAEIYGLGEEELVAPEPPSATAVSALLRGDPGSEELVRHLGRWAAICREQTELENLLDVPARGQIARFPPAGEPTDPPYEQAEKLAEKVRVEFGLGTAPVRSMSSLLDELGIRRVWTNRLGEEIKGLNFNDPRVGPSVVINVENRHCWWTLRSTIAHELCHVLFDRVPTQPYGIVSRRKQHPPIEQRADAFAYYFLAPRAGVKRWFDVRGRSRCALDRNDVHAFASYFALGIEAATWHLKNLGWLTEPQRRELAALRYPTEPELDTESPWADPILADFIKLGVDLERLGLVELARTAHSRGLITEGRFREALGLSPFVDLGSMLEV